MAQDAPELQLKLLNLQQGLSGSGTNLGLVFFFLEEKITDRTAQSWGLSECDVYLCSEEEWCSVRGGSTVAPLASTTHTKPQVLESG